MGTGISLIIVGLVLSIWLENKIMSDNENEHSDPLGTLFYKLCSMLLGKGLMMIGGICVFLFLLADGF